MMVDIDPRIISRMQIIRASDGRPALTNQHAIEATINNLLDHSISVAEKNLKKVVDDKSETCNTGHNPGRDGQ